MDALLGVMLLGSFSAGMADETSDYDIQIVVTDEGLKRDAALRDITLVLDRKTDCWVTSLSELTAYDRHGPDVRELTHALFPVDKGGTVQAAVEALTHYPKTELPPLISARLDSYYDGVFRSLKCFRHNFNFGGYQMAARSMEFFVETIWAVNGMVMPFLNRAPYLLDRLGILPMPHDELRSLMERIARDADIKTQIALLERMFAFMENLGYKKVLDDWEGVLEREVALHK